MDLALLFSVKKLNRPKRLLFALLSCSHDTGFISCHRILPKQDYIYISNVVWNLNPLLHIMLKVGLKRYTFLRVQWILDCSWDDILKPTTNLIKSPSPKNIELSHEERVCPEYQLRKQATLCRSESGFKKQITSMLFKY